MGKHILILLLGTLALSQQAVGGVFQCADGTFSDRPCAEPGGKTVNLHAAPQAPTQFDGLGDVQTVEAGAGPVAPAAPSGSCDRGDYHTKAAIEQGLKDWTIARCMTTDQVERVIRRQPYREFSHVNGNGQNVTEWVFEGAVSRRVVFVDGLVTEIR